MVSIKRQLPTSFKIATLKKGHAPLSLWKNSMQVSDIKQIIRLTVVNVIIVDNAVMDGCFN